MKKIGFLMITIGFLAGALAAVVEQNSVRWGYFAAAFVVGAVGVVLARAGHHRRHKSEEKLNENIRAIETALGSIVDNITTLNSQKDSINTCDVRHHIDELFPADIATFIEGRKSIAHVYGLIAYGDVMSSFAAGERYLNRVWSASADGYINEVNTYLDKAQEQFTESLNKVKCISHKS